MYNYSIPFIIANKKLRLSSF